MTERLKGLAYYNTGGSAKQIYLPKDVNELVAAMRDIKAKGWPHFFLGGGTNSLVLDDEWPGAVVAFCAMTRLEVSGRDQIIVGAGVENSELANFALAKGLAGIGWMYGLPGQMGGTVRMNARCYGGEISQVAVMVTTVNTDGIVKTYDDPAIFKGYKDTIFMDNGEAIAEVVLQLRQGDKQAIKAEMDNCRSDRESKGQYVYPTCGCVFKNNYQVGVPSGMLLERAGVKQLQLKGTQINPHHANFVYNVNAGSREIIETTLKMRELVHDTFGVWLEYEMEILGQLPADLKARVMEKREQNFIQAAIEPLRAEFKARS